MNRDPLEFYSVFYSSCVNWMVSERGWGCRICCCCCCMDESLETAIVCRSVREKLTMKMGKFSSVLLLLLLLRLLLVLFMQIRSTHWIKMVAIFQCDNNLFTCEAFKKNIFSQFLNHFRRCFVYMRSRLDRLVSRMDVAGSFATVCLSSHQIIRFMAQVWCGHQVSNERREKNCTESPDLLRLFRKSFLSNE